ncbi:MAG: hypothetical protein SNH94_00650 [Rikenellaceae bacterium]
MNYSAITVETLNSIASTKPVEERAAELIARCREVSKCGVINRLEYGKSFTVEAERYNELGLYAQAKEFIAVDDVDDIANLHYYQYCEPLSTAIRELVNKGEQM